MKCNNSEIRLEPKKIAFLKFILEGYDGLATVTTLDRKEGLVRLIYPESRTQELNLLIQELLPRLVRSS